MSQYQIKIDEPCHENWDTMSQKQQGRFCSVCTKDVVDFTSMTDQEVKSYFLNYKGSLCGRFNTNQLEQKDERYYKLNDYTKKFIRAFAMVFLMFTAMESSAQTKMPTPIMGAVHVNSNMEQQKGVIFGSDGAGIPNVMISIYQNGELKHTYATDKDGSYDIYISKGDYEVRISKVGYKGLNSDVKIDANGTFGDFEIKEALEDQIAPPPVMGRIRMMGKPRIVQPKK